jgi:peptidyl-prolyl cis-trans isomerase D
MMKFLRSQSQTVLVIVLGVIAVGFLFYGNAGNLLTAGTSHTNNDFGRIDGDDLSVADIYDTVRNTRNAIRIFGQGEQLQRPGAGAWVAENAWKQLLLLHEADRLHIYVGPDEIADWIRKQSVFQKNGAFSIDAYNDEMKVLQANIHLTPEAGVDPLVATKTMFENIIRDNLRTEAVTNALFSSVRNSAHDVADKYQKIYGPTTVSYVVFDPKNYAAQASVTPADIEAEYKNNPTNPAYRTSEKRKVDFVLFNLTPDQIKLPDDQKKAAKDALGQKALDFALAFQPDPSAAPGTPAPNVDFHAEATKRGLTPSTTDFFAEDQPPANVPPSPAFNSAAFSLSKDDTISKVIELDNGVAVLHLDEIQPSALRPLDEVKADIQKQLLQTRAQQSAQVTAQLEAKLLQTAVAKGTDFKTAAAGMKLTVQTVPTFVPNSVQAGDPKLQSLAYQAIGLDANQVSAPFRLADGDSFAVLHVDSRGQPAPAGLADFEKRLRGEEDQQLRTLVTADWVDWKSKQPGTHKPPDLDAYGTVE